MLLVATSVVCALGVAAELVRHLTSSDSALIQFLSLSEEGNLPTWYASTLLAGCALALASVTYAVGEIGGPFVRLWGVLALGFLVMSLDETAQLHERMHSGSIEELHGVLYFNWIVPATIVVLFVGVSYLRFLISLPPRTRRWFLLSGALYVGGAVGMEIPLGVWAHHAGEANLGYALIDAVEESMELFGAALFLLAVLDHRARLAESTRLATS